jgi:hypothetical protein
MKTPKPKRKQKHGALFNNPMVERARKAMSPEQLKEYEEIGKYMYDNTKFETINAINPNCPNMTGDMLDALDYIDVSIRSGQHISTLEDNEKMILKEAYGEKWYEKYGYSEKDLNEIL